MEKPIHSLGKNRTTGCRVRLNHGCKKLLLRSCGLIHEIRGDVMTTAIAIYDNNHRASSAVLN